MLLFNLFFYHVSRLLFLTKVKDKYIKLISENASKFVRNKNAFTKNTVESGVQPLVSLSQAFFYETSFMKQHTIVPPTLNVMTLNTFSTVPLVGILKSIKNKPIILAIGSMTCPPFVKNLEKLLDAVKNNNNVFVIIIYIFEAHPYDGWYIGEENNIVGTYFSTPKQHRTIFHRIDAANMFSKLFENFYTVVDTFDNNCAKFFGTYYSRFVVLSEDKILFLQKAGPDGLDVNEILEKVNIKK